jgi:hypothetical protein
MSTDRLPVAHRVWAEPDGTRQKNFARSKSKKASTQQRARPAEPSTVLFFDMETTTDHLQSLTFGSWQYCRVADGGLVCIDEGIWQLRTHSV